VLLLVVSLGDLGGAATRGAVDYKRLPDRAARGYSVSVADLNADAKPDFVSCWFDFFLVHLGISAGRYGSPMARPVAHYCDDTAVADVDDDGDLDVLVAALDELHEGQLIVYRGAGDGTLEHLDTYATASTWAIAVGDVNGDGAVDAVLTGENPHGVVVFIGNGDGSFEPPVTFPLSDNPDDLAVADLDRDGIDDIVALGRGSIDLWVYRGVRDALPAPLPARTLPRPAEKLAVGNLVPGPSLDVALVADHKRGTLILKGNESMDFVLRARLSSEPHGASSITVADLNGDARLDVAAGFNYGLYTYFNRGRRGFTRPIVYSIGYIEDVGGGFGTFVDADTVASADLNGDAATDLFVAARRYETFLQRRRRTRCRGRVANVIGSSAKDFFFVRTPFRVVMRAGSGPDAATTSQFNDLACLGRGADRQSGLRGDDRIYGGAGDDNIRGGPGDDLLIGGPGHDLCTGGTGTDVSVKCEGEDPRQRLHRRLTPRHAADLHAR
jgi:Ca2+-binding RTX toxin-like protein